MKKILRIFDKKIKLYDCYLSDLKYIFSKEKFNYFNGKTYPQKHDLIDKNIYAYKVNMMITKNGLITLKKILIKYFPLNFDNINNKPIVHEGIAIALTNEFNGTVMYLITNNINLLNDIDLAKLSPPPPWIVFPNEDPRGLGSMQGDMEYWFLNHWDPFWNSLNFNNKRQYLKIFRTNKYWSYYLMMNPYYVKNKID